MKTDKYNIIATIEEIKALNDIHLFIHELKKGNINFILQDNSNELYHKFYMVYEKFSIMNKYLCDWLDDIEQEKRLKLNPYRHSTNEDDIYMSLQILHLNDIIDYDTYNKLMEKVKNEK